MEEIRNKELEELLDMAEDWNYRIYSEEDGRAYVEMETSSPAGEDFIMYIDFNQSEPVTSFLNDLKEYYDDFDPEEHAEMYIDSRGQNGVPGTIRELLDDADAIKAMIGELWKELTGKQPQENENIIEIPCSAGMICAQISGDSNYPGIYTYLRLPDGTEIDICAVEGNEVGELNAYIYENTSSDDWTRKIHYSKDDLNI